VSILRQRISDAAKEHASSFPEPEDDAPKVLDEHEARKAELRPTAAPPPPAARDRLPADVHEKVHKQIVRDLGPLLYDENVEQDILEEKLNASIESAFVENGAPTAGDQYLQFKQDVRNDVIGYGPIE